MKFTFQAQPRDGLAQSIDRYALSNFIEEIVRDDHPLSIYDGFYYNRKPWKHIDRNFIGHIVHNTGDTLA